MKNILRIALAVIVASAASAAHAQTATSTAPPSNKYMSLRLGMAVPQHDDLDAYDSGFAFEAGVGFRLNPNIAVEANVGRFAVNAKQSGYDPDVMTTVTVEGTAAAVPLTGTVKVILPVQNVELFGLAGAGLYFVSAHSQVSAVGYGTLVDISDDATTLGVHLGGGLSAAVSPRVRVGGELKYVIASAKLFDETYGLDSLIVGATVGYSF